uniref:NADH-ubiquinone oxidoreductase chain 1 n=1 Tax=Paratimomenus flavocapitatus TaxID=2021295 RepID=A0A678PBX6_9NEOP|nr:NADH dehydrogenase subunit 1 [Paratimomenus flavocapitatus]
MDFMDNITMGLSLILLIVGILVSVAFFTLLERKILGYIQIRKGPNKTGWSGLFQPFSDAVKLFSKENITPQVSNFSVYYVSPVMALFLSMFLWVIIPLEWYQISFGWGVLFFFCITSLGVYTGISAGWASNSNYSLIGGLRIMAQTISYEVSLALIMLFFLGLVKGFELNLFKEFQVYIWFIGLGIPLSLTWFITSLAETNRAPLDLAEGESELVSGFNVEYGGGGFAMIFLGEYCSILFMSLLFMILCLGGLQLAFLICFFILGGVGGVFIWARGTVPRVRYDKLMDLTWKIYLPVALFYLIFMVGVMSIV